MLNESDDISKTELENYQNLDIQDEEKDFNYNDLLTKDLSIKKLPFINRNRKVFCNSDGDFIDLMTPPSEPKLYNAISQNFIEIKSLLSFIKDGIQMIISNDLNFKSIQDMSLKHLDKLKYDECMYSHLSIFMHEKLEKLAESIIMRRVNMIQQNAYSFL